MERFGSARLRIVWTSLSVLLALLVAVAIRPAEGGNLLVFGTPIPINAMTILVDPAAVFRGALTEIIASLVPWTLLLAAFVPGLEALKTRNPREVFSTLGLGLVNGLFFSQILLLPIWAASWRLLGTPLPGLLCLADLNATLLGTQLYLWSMALALVLRSNPGLAVVATAFLQVAGQRLAWAGTFLGDPEVFQVPMGLVKTFAFLGKLLPSGQVPTDPLALTALPLSLGGPLVLVALLLFVPGGKGKPAARTSRKAKG